VVRIVVACPMCPGKLFSAFPASISCFQTYATTLEVVFVVGVMVLEGAQQGGHLQRGERSRPKPVTPFQVRPRASHHPPSAVRAPRAVVAGRRRGKELSSAALADAQEGRSDLGRISITESRFSICPWPVARVARVVSLCGESR
jgi:hypothetical protein